MQYSKKVIRVLYLAFLLIVLASSLSACNQKSTQDQILVSGNTLSAPLPIALLTVDENNLVVGVVDTGGVLNGGAPINCDNLTVDQDNGTFSCKILLPAGTYTLALEYSIIDAAYGTVPVMTTSGIGVDVIAGRTTEADYSGATPNYNHDNDTDGINNFTELDEGSNPNTPSYYVGGTISGLIGSGGVIQLNGNSDLPLSTDGSFHFIPAVDDNTTYTITVFNQPVGQTCSVSNEHGAVSSANVTDVSVTCIDIDTTAPSVVSTFNEPIIDVSTRFSLVFDETMDPQSLVLSGDLAGDTIASWSQGTVVDDTLTIAPVAEWPIGVGQSLTIDADDLFGNPLTTLTLVFDVSVIHVSTDATNADDSNPGTRNLPLKTIQAAVDLANTILTKSEIRVALGTYATFSELGDNIVVSDGMRLLGSYSADWLLRNPATYATIVNDTSTTTGDFNNPNCAVTISAGAGSETLVNGFTLNGGGVTDGSGNGASCGIEIEMNASPTIENNIISGGAAASSNGIIDRGLSSIIKNNTISGSETGAQSNAVSGISSNGSSPTITANNIFGGHGIAGRSSGTGISLTDVNAIVEKNMVVGGSTEASTGVSISGVSTVALRNNTIHGGNSYSTYGVSIGPGTTTTLQSNTIYAGNSGGFALALGISSPAIIENNILFGLMCIREGGADADPLRLFNNNLYGCEQRFFYYDYDAQCTSNGDGDNNASTCTLAEMNALPDMQVDNSNINVDLGFGTQADADWHLSAASPASVKFGGLDLSVDFTTDKDGVERTAPWSIGAYEQD